MKNYFKKYGLVWGFNTRIDCLDKEILKKSAEAGCKYLFTGVETLVPEVILGMNKIIPRKNKDYPPPIFTPEDYIQRGIEIYQKMENLGIQKSAFLVFGGPKKIVKRGKIKIGIESFNDAKESIDRTVFELKPHFISINILRFIPSAIMSYSPRYEVLRGQKSPFSSGYYSSLYRKKHNIKKRTHKHQIYLAFEAASDFYPIPPKMSPRYCYKILNYLVKQVNQHNKKSETKTIIWVDKEFQKYMPRNKEGIYCLAPFKKISSKTINETKHSVPPSRT